MIASYQRLVPLVGEIVHAVDDQKMFHFDSLAPEGIAVHQREREADINRTCFFLSADMIPI